MASEFAGKAKFVMVDCTEAGNQIATDYDVIGLPTVIVFKNGQVSGSVLGANLPQIRAEVEKAM